LPLVSKKSSCSSTGEARPVNSSVCTTVPASTVYTGFSGTIGVGSGVGVASSADAPCDPAEPQPASRASTRPIAPSTHSICILRNFL